MADFKIQGITPAEGKLKLGSSDVSKIYNGSTLVWPIANDSGDPYEPVFGAARFVATDNGGVINLYDTSFNTITPLSPFGLLPNSNYHLGGVSDNLSYMVACGHSSSTEEIKISLDGGQTFSNPSSGTFQSDFKKTMVSKSGKVILSAVPTTTYPPTSDANWMISTDYGVNFIKVTLPSVIAVVSALGGAISSGGKFIAISNRVYTNTGTYIDKAFYSKDYGATWNDASSFGQGNRRWKPLISGSGEYLIFINISDPSNSFYSSDYAENFIQKNYTGLEIQPATILGTAMNESGQYYIFSETLYGNGGGVVYGNNYGSTLPQNRISTDSTGARNVRISNSGGTILWSDEGSSAPDYSFSDNFGSTWSTVQSAPSSVGQGPVFLVDVS